MRRYAAVARHHLAKSDKPTTSEGAPRNNFTVERHISSRGAMPVLPVDGRMLSFSTHVRHASRAKIAFPPI